MIMIWIQVAITNVEPFKIANILSDLIDSDADAFESRWHLDLHIERDLYF